jgi:hypothetical protein
MPEILQVFTIERRLYGEEAIPWTYLLLPSNLQSLRDRYKFGQIGQQSGPGTTPGQVVATGGEFRVGEAAQALEQLVIEPAAIQFQISTDSKGADALFSDLGEFLRQVDPNKNFADSKERARTYQTVAVARLAVGFASIFSDAFLRYLERAVAPRVRLPDSEVDLGLERLSWGVRYKTQRADLMYIPKPLTIEPRRGTKESDRIYYTQSPTDFPTHVELLDEFEKSLAAELPRQATGSAPREKRSGR